MLFKKLTAVVAITFFAASVFANPKCNHRAGDGLFSSTNPTKSVRSATPTTSVSGSQSGVK